MNSATVSINLQAVLLSFMQYGFIFLIFSSLAITQSIFADELRQAQQNLEEISAKVSQIERGIAKHIHDRNQLQREMEKLDTQIGTLHREMQLSNRQVLQVKQRSKQLNDKDSQLRKELAEQGNAFKQQVRIAYLAQRQSKWKLLLSQNNIQDAGKVAVMYDYVNQARVQHIQDLVTLAQELEDNQVQLKLEQKRLQALIQQQTQQNQVLQNARKQKHQAQGALAILIEEGQDKLKREQKNQKAIQQLIRKLRNHTGISGNFVAQQGRLHWPVKGKLLNKYGSTKNRGAKITWDGVGIQATRGSEVRAIFPGKVIFSDWFQGYGWLLIIDHGDGFMSLYAHAEGLHKEVGEAVELGEVIASVGDSGGATQPNLYFEIRRQGAPVDPADWCAVPKMAYSS